MPPLSLVRPGPPLPSPLQGLALVAFSVFALGTTLYALVVPAWSGHDVATLEVPRAEAMSPPAVLTRAPAVGPVHLDPAMNPVRVLAHIEYRPQPSRATSCRVLLRGPDGRPVWAEDRDFGAYAIGQSRRPNLGTTLVVQTFDVPRAGAYTLAMDFGPGGWETIHAARLEVRSRVATVRPWFVGVGALLALASLVTLLVTSPGPARGDATRSRAA